MAKRQVTALFSSASTSYHIRKIIRPRCTAFDETKEIPRKFAINAFKFKRHRDSVAAKLVGIGTVHRTGLTKQFLREIQHGEKEKYS